MNQGEVFVSQSGSFPCEAILHVCGQRDAGIIEQLVRRIIEHCETFGFKSVAIPAICAGKIFVRLSRCSIISNTYSVNDMNM